MFFFLLISFLLDIFFIYISNAIPFPSFLSKIPYALPLPLLPNPPTPAFWPWHSPILGHRTFTGPRASPPIDDQLVHPQLHIQLEPWVPPCVFFVGGLVPGTSGLVPIVVPTMELQTTSAPWVLFLAPSLGNLCTGWLWEFTSIFVRHWKTSQVIARSCCYLYYGLHIGFCHLVRFIWGSSMSLHSL